LQFQFCFAAGSEQQLSRHVNRVSGGDAAILRTFDIVAAAAATACGARYR